MMKSDFKHFFKVGGILCAIGGASALLIGATNLLTADTISQMSKEKEEKALLEVFIDEDGNLPTDLVAGDKLEIASDDEKYAKLLCYWNPTSSEESEGNDNKYGYVFKTEGSDKNNYGTITMLVAISNNFEIGKISIIKNTESYASTIMNDYVNPYNNGDISLSDVSCGATYGATAIKEMAEASLDYVKEVL